MLTLLLSSSLMIHNCYLKPNIDETLPSFLESSETHQSRINCPKEKIGCS